MINITYFFTILLWGTIVTENYSPPCWTDFPGTSKFQKGEMLTKRDTSVNSFDVNLGNKKWRNYRVSDYFQIKYNSSDEELFCTINFYKTKKKSFPTNHIKSVERHSPRTPENIYLTPFDSIKIEGATFYFVQTLNKTMDRYAHYIYIFEDKSLFIFNFQRLKNNKQDHLDDKARYSYIREFLGAFIRYQNNCLQNN